MRSTKNRSKIAGIAKRHASCSFSLISFLLPPYLSFLLFAFFLISFTFPLLPILPSFSLFLPIPRSPPFLFSTIALSRLAARGLPADAH